MELFGEVNMVSMLSFDSRSIGSILDDRNSQHFQTEYVLIRSNNHSILYHLPEIS